MSSKLYLGRYEDTLDGETWDALITDPPYSEKTHRGHNDARIGDGCDRRKIHYAAWSMDDVARFVEWAHPRTRGWMVCFCDHVLAPAYIAAMEAQGRYVFTPIAWYSSGSRIRMTGDGPACWVTWIIVSRPKSAAFCRWGALPGGYEGFKTDANNARYVGGKPVWLMRAIVRDYSRPGGVVCDPCAGWGTTLVAARAEGRRWVGSEMDAEAHCVALARTAELPQGTTEQPALFGDDE